MRSLTNELHEVEEEMKRAVMVSQRLIAASEDDDAAGLISPTSNFTRRRPALGANEIDISAVSEKEMHLLTMQAVPVEYKQKHGKKGRSNAATCPPLISPPQQRRWMVVMKRR